MQLLIDRISAVMGKPVTATGEIVADDEIDEND
ncbi:hypothetical protein JOD69_003659 [Methylocaldum sp. RMAD-M]|jgi:hypothetical protein|nr:hypothetical protein [Methylocaldum sp. RMAD-M]